MTTETPPIRPSGDGPIRGLGFSDDGEGSHQALLDKLGKFAAGARACGSLAWSNLSDQGPQLAASIIGIAVALALLLLQLSILDAASRKVTALYDDFNFDIAIIPDSYQFLVSFDTIDRIVLDIARATGDVDDTYGLNVTVTHWTQWVPIERLAYNLLIGISPPGKFVRDPRIRAGWALLATPHTLLADAYSLPTAGAVSPGTAVTIHDERMTIAGQFRLGLFFYADGAAIVRNVDFSRLTGRDPRQISLGLIRVKPGVSIEKARSDIAAALPSGMVVLTKSQLERQERDYFLSTKPIGIMIQIGMVIACLTAGAIILQVLLTDVANRLCDFAVLKAIGAAPIFVFGVSIAQAALLGFGGLLLAIFLVWPVLRIIQYRTHLEAVLSTATLGEAALVTAVLVGASGLYVTRRIARADPASLY